MLRKSVTGGDFDDMDRERSATIETKKQKRSASRRELLQKRGGIVHTSQRDSSSQYSKEFSQHFSNNFAELEKQVQHETGKNPVGNILFRVPVASKTGRMRAYAPEWAPYKLLPAEPR